MADFTRIGGNIARGAEEDADHVHQLGVGEVDHKGADKSDVHNEEGVEVKT